MTDVQPISDRRPIKARRAGWARSAALWLAGRRISPNMISVMSVVFSGVAGVGFAGAGYRDAAVEKIAFLMLAVVGIQLRLVCNLLDGMVAIEGQYGTSRTGEIYNDLPDRIADPVILLSATLAADVRYGLWIGMLATVGALMTAYVRVLGRSIGAGSHFAGPMAKQHRMAVMTLSSIVGASVVYYGYERVVISAGLGLIAVGCVVTVIRRLVLIRKDLQEP